mgnify:CR=1 FL=1
MRRLKKRQKMILRALKELGGLATSRQIAEKTDLHVNGVAQTLGALSDEYIRYVGGRAGEAKWGLEKE